MAAPLDNEAGQQQQQQQGADKSRTIPGLNKAAEGGRPPRSKSGNDLAGSAASATAAASAGGNGNSVTGMSAIDSPVSGSPPGSSAGNGNNGSASLPPIAAGPRGEESLSATLERLRLNAQAAKNGAQSGGAGAIGSRGDGRGPAPNSRLAKASLPAGVNGITNPAAAAALARGGSTGSAAGGPPGQNDPQMSNFLFDDELDNELHNSTYGGRYLQMNADDDKFPVLIRRDSFPGINQSRNAFMQEHGGRTSEWPQFTGSNATNTASTATTQKANTGSNTPTGGAAAPSGPANGPTNRMSADMSSVVNGARRGESSPRNRQLPPPRSATTGTSPNSAAAAGQGSAPSSATTATSASNGPSSAATPTSTAPLAELLSLSRSRMS